MATFNSTRLSSEGGLVYRRLFINIVACVGCLAELMENRENPGPHYASVVDALEIFGSRVESILDELEVPRDWR